MSILHLYSTFWVGCPDWIFAIVIGNRLLLWYDVIWSRMDTRVADTNSVEDQQIFVV